MDEQRVAYGGQAVLEGVMMRGRHQATVAVRRPTGEIALKHIPLSPRASEGWQSWPILRAFVSLREAFVVGKAALDFSATVATNEDEEELPRVVQLLIFAVALAIGVGLFVVVPSLVANMVSQLGAPVLLREVVEGLLNLLMVVGYIYVISRMRDIQRVFGYHGAEHKVINAYEAGAPLTVEAVRPFTRIHPRCGTSFLVITALIGFVIFLSVAALPLWLRIGSRIVLIPLVAAVAFEVMRLAAANFERPWVRRLLGPTLASQYLTTREPDDEMIAVAIAALTPVLTADGAAADLVAAEPEAALARGSVAA